MKKMIALLFAMTMVGLTACDEGPVEEFGEDVDEAVEDTADAVDDAVN